MENELENDDLHPIARRGFERLRTDRHPRADGHSHQDPKTLAAELDDLVLANNQASTSDGAVLVVRITLEAIAEKLFGNGKQ